MKDIKNYSLKAHNTFGIDANCARYLEFSSVEEAQQVAAILRESVPIPYIIIGGGSNLLLTKDYDGTVVRSDIRGVDAEGTRLRCGSGEAWDDVVAYCVENGLYGAENLSLIPGDVGATAIQNIGAYGVEVKDLIAEVRAVEIATGAERVFSAAECGYAYRQSRFKNEWKDLYLITEVVYQLAGTFAPRLDYGNIRMLLEQKGIVRPTPQQLRETIIDIRESKLPDPKVEGNAGSFFMNPIVSKEKFCQLLAAYPQMPHYPVDETHEKIPAGWMIDQCGWKGKSLGRAGVHTKQALVLVNRGGAEGEEIVTLCEAIRRDVQLRFGITIYPEVNII